MTSISSKTRQYYPELERLICVALSNQQFAAALISAPATALEHSGYGRWLSPAERAMVHAITGAVDIYDFAARLYSKTSGSETLAPVAVATPPLPGAGEGVGR
jgi:hypothetical protein